MGRISSESDELFTDVICIRSLEHVENPVRFLEHMGYDCLKEDGGRLHIIVPNGKSWHRLIDVKKGKISNWDNMTDRDKQVGHLRVYDMPGLISDIEEAGLNIVYSTDFFAKQVNTATLGDITNLDPNHVFAENCYVGGEVLHDLGIYNLGTQLYIVAERK